MDTAIERVIVGGFIICVLLISISIYGEMKMKEDAVKFSILRIINSDPIVLELLNADKIVVHRIVTPNAPLLISDSVSITGIQGIWSTPK